MEMRPKLIDSHCHLLEPEFASDMNDVIESAKAKGILIINSAISPASWEACIRMAATNPSVYASIGLDPMLYDQAQSAVDFITKHAGGIVSVGECGIDHFRATDHSERQMQEDAFRILVKLSSQLGIPVQVHSRSAGAAALEILSSTDAQLVHMHAFDGRANLARVASRERGYYFSIPTSVVHSPQKRKLVKAVDYERLLVETDSPVLGPVAGIRNEPANLWIAVREISMILGRSEDEVASTVLENTLRLYRRIRVK